VAILQQYLEISVRSQESGDQEVRSQGIKKSGVRRSGVRIFKKLVNDQIPVFSTSLNKLTNNNKNQQIQLGEENSNNKIQKSSYNVNIVLFKNSDFELE
jgi:hypothetical protein